MKIASNKIIALSIGLLCCNFTFAAPDPPQPIPPPVGLPIDAGVSIVLLFGLLFAFTKLSKIKKTSKI